MIDVLGSKTAVNVSGLSVPQSICFIKGTDTAAQVKDGTVRAASALLFEDELGQIFVR